jgi:phosphatidylglycerol:prolipoprotein diacylglycerol transferase
MNRVLLDLGFIQIYWYSVCIIIGMMIGMYLVYTEAARKKISENLITNLIFYTVIISIIGARLYYVIFKWDYYSKNIFEIFEIWNGGLAIHGAIIFGGLFLIYYTKKHKLDTLRILDICCVGLIIGQVFGRWGNFFNQEAYGSVVSLNFLKSLHLPGFIIDGMHINGAYYHPTFLYESLWCIVGFIILILFRKRRYIKTGQIFGIYCMWYSLGRFFIEGLRTDSLMLGSIKMAQIVSIGMFLVGLFFFIRRLREGRFDHLYNEVEKEENNEPSNVITQYNQVSQQFSQYNQNNQSNQSNKQL